MYSSTNFLILAMVLVIKYPSGIPEICLANAIAEDMFVHTDLNQHVVPDMQCTIYRQYQELLLLNGFHFCSSAVDIWEPMNELLRKQNSTHDCVTSIISTMAHLFPQSSQIHCQCTPDFFQLPSPSILHTIPPTIVGKRSLTADFYNCLAQDLAFKELYHRFYAASPNETLHLFRSFSHHHVWSLLSMVRLNCRNILITSLANTYGYHHGKSNYICTPVEHKSTTVSSLITTSHTALTSVSSPITTSHTAMTTPTTYLTTTTQTASCDISQLTYGIEHEVILSPSANCPSKVFQSEQVPLAYCTLPPIYIAWRPGPKVIDTCQSLPNYTAIATFTSGSFNPYIDIAGIFLGCIEGNTAFKAVIALCNSKMTIEDVTQDNSIFFHLPENYHVIMS